MVKLQIDHLTKHYWLEREDREVLALSDVSFSVEDGELTDTAKEMLAQALRTGGGPDMVEQLKQAMA